MSAPDTTQAPTPPERPRAKTTAEAPPSAPAQTTPAEVGGQSSLLERHHAAEVLRLQAYSRDLEARLRNVEERTRPLTQAVVDDLVATRAKLDVLAKERDEARNAERAATEAWKRLLGDEAVARAEVERLKAVLSNALVTFGPVTRHGRFSEGAEQRGNRVDCEDALKQMTAAIRARGGGK